jgi:hypothetical protein
MFHVSEVRRYSKPQWEQMKGRLDPQTQHKSPFLLSMSLMASVLSQVRRYGKPQWEQSEFSRNPIDNIIPTP